MLGLTAILSSPRWPFKISLGWQGSPKAHNGAAPAHGREEPKPIANLKDWP